MPSVPPGVQFTRREYAYLAWHVGWRDVLPGVLGEQLVYRRVGVDEQESLLISSAYRPKSENSALGAGPDIGIEMWNTELSRIRNIHDPFIVFHPLDALEQALLQAYAEPSKPFARWSYPGRKTDGTIQLAAVLAEVGPIEHIYDISHSPYWKMMWAGMDVRGLPVPPADVYVSRVPRGPLRYGQAFQEGRINALQKWLADNRLFTGGFDNYYGPRVRDGVRKVQELLARLGLWSGPSDGAEWSVALVEVLDAILEFDYLTLWG